MRQFMQRYSRRVSYALIGLATAGFAWTTYYDWRIKALEGEVRDSEVKLDRDGANN